MNELALRELALFAGAGGGILGGHLLGWRTVAAVEIEDYPRRVLLQRQADGILPRFPIWDDVQTFDGKPWRGKVDVISGGFPCQDISCAGKGAGIDGERSGMWGHMARIIGEVLPRYVFVENSPMLVGRGLARVLGDLASMGYDARWGVLGAHHAGAPHKRDRIWIVADSYKGGRNRCQECNIIKEAIKPTSWRYDDDGLDLAKHWSGFHSSEISRAADGMAHRVDRLKAIGNGQVPAVAALAWRILTAHSQYRRLTGEEIAERRDEAGDEKELAPGGAAGVVS